MTTHIITERKLVSGARLIHIQIPGYPLSAVSAWFQAGSRFDPKGKEGLAHFFEHLLTTQTKQQPDRVKRSQLLEELGICLSAYTNLEACHFDYIQLPEYFFEAVQHLLDGIQNTVFTKKAVDHERNIILDELNRDLKDPEEFLWHLQCESLWPGSGMGKYVLGSKKSLAQITLADLNSFQEKFYTLSNMVLVCVSNEDTDKVQTALEKNMEPREDQSPSTPEKIPYKAVVPVRVEKGTSDHAVCDIAWRTVAATEAKEAAALNLLRILLASSFNSRLIRAMRVKKNLTYWVNGTTANFSDTGYITFSFSSGKQTVVKALEVALKEITAIRKSLLTDKELATAKTTHLTRALRICLDPENILEWYGYDAVAGTPVEDFDSYRTRVEALTASDIQEVARKYLTRELLSIVIIGKVSEKSVRKIHNSYK